MLSEEPGKGQVSMTKHKKSWLTTSIVMCYAVRSNIRKTLRYLNNPPSSLLPDYLSQSEEKKKKSSYLTEEHNSL